MKAEDFQQHTTLQQSTVLKALGASQENPDPTLTDDYLVWYEDGPTPEEWRRSDGLSLPDTEVRLVPNDYVDSLFRWDGGSSPPNLDEVNEEIARRTTKAFHLQEMYHALLLHYGVGLDVLSGETELSLWHKDAPDMDLPIEHMDPIAPVFISGADPFPAVYDALCWHLKQTKEAA